MVTLADAISLIRNGRRPYREALTHPAVYTPWADIVPLVAVHVTAVLADPVTVAVNACCPPGTSVAFGGVTETWTPLAPPIVMANLGLRICVPAVLTNRIISPGLLFTSMIPWLVAGAVTHDCT
jgi:hypothetical protein